MFKITIKSQIHGEMFLLKETQAEVDAYIEECKLSQHWGRNAGVSIIPAIEEIKDEAGVVVQEAVPEQIIEHSAEYELVVEDVSVQMMQEKVNKECLAYLAATDYLIIREMDNGVKCPEDVKAKRQECREKIIK